MTTLTLHIIGPNDYAVRENRRSIGCIRLAEERNPSIWLWNVTVTLPGPPFGDAKDLAEAKARFKAAWEAFKAKHGPDKLAEVYAEMDHANRPGRYER